MKKFFLITLLSLVFSFSSCGYRFSVNGNLPGTVNRITVVMFENNTVESGAETVFTNALTDEILEKSDAKIVHLSEAEAFITGTIKSISLSALSRSSDDSVTERRVSAILDLEMKDNNGEILWSAYSLRDSADYSVSSDNYRDQALQRAAVKEIARRISEKAVGSMLDRF